MPSWLIWVIIAVVVIAVIVAVVVAGSRKKKERDRVRAGELREQAAAQASGLQQREAAARETEAEAAAARAEAERKQAEAERLEAQAGDRHRAAGAAREEHQEHLRRADQVDPDVNTKHDDYVAPDATDAERTHTGAGTTEHGRTAEPEPTTVTHPDGTTESVSDPGATDQGGTHRA
jgi:hypothetical protein